ncbi:NUDIX hydrolase [Myroides odoratus]|uniref:NUDIX hydrolase n=1 Tax=Myroides odoratus TaxID=256 RepID=UPI0039AFB684
MAQSKTIYLASAIITNPFNHFLTVRKRGSIYFMLAGGKIESEETPITALQRELKEELGLAMDLTKTHYLGTHQTQAVNEPNTLVHATVYHLELPVLSIHPQAELEEVKWLTFDTYKQVPLANLLKEFALPYWLKNEKSQL